jgi:hypothetical protein
MDHGAETNSLLGHFAVLKDPRRLAKVLDPLPEALLLVLCATLAGADDFVESRRGARRAWSSCGASWLTSEPSRAMTR